MTCTSPPAISDRDLLAFLDGVASAKVEQHLAGCLHCRERAAVLVGMEARLSAGLYRAKCPAPEDLGEYHLRLLPDDRAEEIQRHVAGCRLCTQELAGLQEYLADLQSDVEYGAIEAAGARVRVWIAHLVEGIGGAGWGPQPAPAAAGLRGADDGPRIYQAGNIQLSIEMHADPDEPNRRRVFGLLLGSSPDKFRAHLWQHGVHMVSVPVDGDGNFVMTGREPGSYDLILEGPGVEVHVQDLTVL